MNSELIEALKQIEREKGITVETLLSALRDALSSAYKRNYDGTSDIRVDINEDNGTIKVFSIEQIGEGEDDFIEVEVTPDNFGRIAAQTAKQVILQRIREAQRDIMFDEYSGREGDIVTGIVEQSDSRYTLVNLGKVEALLPQKEQVPTERYEHGARLKTFITEVIKSSKGPQIIVSRTHPGLLKRLFELEVPEIYDGFVEIKSVAREPGARSKIAVFSSELGVDPVGACVGPRGQRVGMVVSELRGEKIDVVEWNEDPKMFVANALSPSKVKEVKIYEGSKTAEVVVPDSQLSLAIGKEGQNARLAAKLTGWRIDIKSESQVLKQIAEELMMAPAVEEDSEDMCRAVKKNGERCNNKVKPGSRYCGIPSHQKLEAEIPGPSAEGREPEEETEIETEPETEAEEQKAESREQRAESEPEAQSAEDRGPEEPELEPEEQKAESREQKAEPEPEAQSAELIESEQEDEPEPEPETETEILGPSAEGRGPEEQEPAPLTGTEPELEEQIAETEAQSAEDRGPEEPELEPEEQIAESEPEAEPGSETEAEAEAEAEESSDDESLVEDEDDEA